MKAFKFIFCLCAMLSLSTLVKAQDKVQHTYYIEIYEVSVLGMKSVNLDFGKDAPAGQVYKIFDDNDQNLDFKNSVAAVNYLSSKGWELVTVFDKSAGKAGSRTVYLLKYDTENKPKNNIVKSIDEYLKDF